nr:K2 [uncultured bacterium]
MVQRRAKFHHAQLHVAGAKNASHGHGGVLFGERVERLGLRTLAIRPTGRPSRHTATPGTSSATLKLCGRL